ncbi:MAG: HlyD family efflux transporter periplasmic adaptor subunit [Acetivibrio sp.]
MAKRNSKVLRYRKPFHLNVGVVVFFIIFIYMVVISINYLRHDRISSYEVVEKNISDDNTYRGIALRDEDIYYTDKAGYINYYIGDGEKAAKGSTIYTIDETGEIYRILSNADAETTLTKEDSKRIRSAISSFQKEYHQSNYSVVSDFKYDVENIILEQNTQSLLTDLNRVTDQASHGSFEVVTLKKSGILSYTMDGMESLQVGEVTSDLFKNVEETRHQLRQKEALAQGSPVFKLINSEDWNIIIPLSNSQYEKLKDSEKVKVRFKKDNVETIVGITVYEKSGSYFANLSLNKYMIRYINDRFLDLEIQLNAAEGLKIPMSSILKKDFLVIPNNYISIGGKSNSTGVIKETIDKDGETKYEFVPVSLISKDETEACVESEKLKVGNYIVDTQKNKKYQLGKMRSLEGVYNINKGFAVFRVIDKIYENKEYVIVRKDTPYGLSTYDRIVVNAETIKESALIK